MARLIDDLRSTGKVEMPWFVQPQMQASWTDHANKILGMLREGSLPVLLIDNVSDYFYTHSDQEVWDYRKDFPNLAPPFDACWFEHRMPSKIHSKTKGDTDCTRWVQGGRTGCLMVAVDPKDTKGEGIPANVKWILWFEVFIDYNLHGRFPQGPHGSIFYAIDAGGALVETPWMQTYCHPSQNEVIKNFMTWLFPALLTICFLHCKNVAVIENRTPKPLAKKYHDRTGLWPIAYKTLVIEPLKQILRKEGRSGEVGLAKSMHICRGHFADYTEGKGLFGRYHGKFWIPQTVRGSRGEKPPAREIEVKV